MTQHGAIILEKKMRVGMFSRFSFYMLQKILHEI